MWSVLVPPGGLEPQASDSYALAVVSWCQVLEDSEVVEHTKGFVSDVVADDTVQRTGKKTGGLAVEKHEDQINGLAQFEIACEEP